MNKSLAVALSASCLLAAGCDSTRKGAESSKGEDAAAAGVEPETARDRRMEWWRDARFGMFIHWGIYAVPAGEWNGRKTGSVAEWIMHTEKIPLPEYEPLAQQFNPVQFNAKEWVAIAKNAGMKYIVITSKHHDGFAMFKTATGTYNIVDGTPYGRDPMKDLAAECAKAGLTFCFYHSIMDWRNPDYQTGRIDEAYTPYMKAQLAELLTNYGPIGVLWFDGEWEKQWTEPRGADLAAYVRSLQPSIIINNRVGKARAGMSGRSAYRGAGDFDTPEQEIPAAGLPGADWESCMTMNDTWGYSKLDHNWKSARTLIRMLCDTSSKGGNLLLNVGPTADGIIPPESVERLAAVGAWMKTNGEAVYATHASPLGRVPWGKCTYKDGTVYLMVFDWPADGRLVVPRLKNRVRGANMLATGERLSAKRTNEGVVVTVPPTAPDADATVIALRISGEPQAEPAVARAGPDGVISLDAADADTTARIEEHNGRSNIGYWTAKDMTAPWGVMIDTPGVYKVSCEVACEADKAGSRFKVTCGSASVTADVPATAGWRYYTRVECGELDLRARGPCVLKVSAAGDLKGSALMNLQAVRLSR